MAPADAEIVSRAALKHHPDRVAADSPERPGRTKRFQQINDAYYTLSDPARRRDYDSTRAFHGFASTPAEDYSGAQSQPPPNTSSSWSSSFPWSTFGFGQRPDNGSGGTAAADSSNAQFASVFEEMLREQGMAEGEQAHPTSKFWSMVGGLSGGAMGFIVANFPGAVAGAVAGNRLGAVRDARGKSVYAVFQELPQGDKAKLLSELAAKVFAHAVGS